MIGVRPRGHDALLRAAQLGRGDELHRLGDLLRGLDGADPPLDVAQCRHGPPAASGRLDPPRRHELGLGLVDRPWRARRASRPSALSCWRSRAGAPRTGASRNGYRNSSKVRICSTGTSSSRPWRPREDDGDLPVDGQRRVLPLLQELDHALAARELLLGGLVEIGAELGEGGELAVLGQVEPELARDLSHGLDLGRARPRARRTGRR